MSNQFAIYNCSSTCLHQHIDENIERTDYMYMYINTYMHMYMYMYYEHESQMLSFFSQLVIIIMIFYVTSLL